MNYLYEHERIVFRTRRGRAIDARRVRPDDRALLADMLGRLSVHTRWLRYMSPRPLAGDAALAEARRIAAGHPALVALGRVGGLEEAIAVAELVPDARDRATGEFALVVRDDEQAGHAEKAPGSGARDRRALGHRLADAIEGDRQHDDRDARLQSGADVQPAQCGRTS